uniref:uncharacterized protein LOC113475617 isoform X2 n=1 Tax=Ciona intestinalis TaxID=7719 RepID=UPI000EF4EF87|nr:uncharacterized protein LOC113475617 isoform X2 [Ciona intestinalis]|eukprot:XP_026695770.1 uncharacterized protein LOC113475617 isoform X2 [Ciona intestinalis]
MFSSFSEPHSTSISTVNSVTPTSPTPSDEEFVTISETILLPLVHNLATKTHPFLPLSELSIFTRVQHCGNPIGTGIPIFG